MFGYKVVKEDKWARLHQDLARLQKVRPIAEALAVRGISADDIIDCRVHLRHNPKRKQNLVYIDPPYAVAGE